MVDAVCRWAGLAAALAGALACAAGSREANGERPGRPRIRVLGTVQDGGLPHPACTCRRCERARRNPAARRFVASIAIVLPDRRIFLVDATPDLGAQLDLLRDVRRAPEGRVDRSPLAGVFLTHAHIGHYLGLAYLGYEAVSTRGIPLYGTPSMLAFIEENEPWRLLVRRGHVSPRAIRPGRPVSLGGGVTVRPLSVPHRDELTDTVGFAIEGPRRSVLYVPDTDGWDRWDPPPEEIVARFDAAIVDGTFFSGNELPGRSTAEIGHPLVRETIDRLGPVVARGTEILFTHLNHSNPALDPGSPERRLLEKAGFRVAREGEELDL